MTPPTAPEASALAVEAPPDGDDIFGPSRSYPPRSNRPKPSMISAKLRAKEERKKVIQICTEKLEKIKDPDRNLRRSVCINNTYFKLQDEVRREKQMKHATNGGRFDDDDVRIRSRKGTPNAEQKQRMLDKALESIDKEISAIDANMPSLDHEMLPEDMGIVNALGPLRNGGDDALDGFGSSPSCGLSLDLAFGARATGETVSYSYCKTNSAVNSRCRTRKRSFEDVEDCDVHEVLSQFYMPPTPISLGPTIDDDALLNVVDDDPVDATRVDKDSRKKTDFENDFDKMLELDTDLNQNKSDFQTLNDFSSEPPTKRAKFDEPEQGERTRRDEDKFAQKRSGKSEFEIILDALRLDDGKEACEREELLYFCGSGKDKEAELRARFLGDSCGQAAILGEPPAAGFHGLLASLET